MTIKTFWTPKNKSDDEKFFENQKLWKPNQYFWFSITFWMINFCKLKTIFTCNVLLFQDLFCWSCCSRVRMFCFLDCLLVLCMHLVHSLSFTMKITAQLYFQLFFESE
ncbi:unnamed protein product [Blepharisma stoltei]|uniref:Uncharacterized protein n=1 Tax=Blepharisma stoltei TaxID=1481888 RepID=A0AAU9IEU0_9CILI|nr:unnamed protein product [Blepharisma stoltei]